jgi:hypothetical protein
MPRTSHPSVYDAAFALMGGSTFYRENFDAGDQSTDVAAALTTQVITAVPIFLEVGDKVTSISTISGATPAGTPTNWWFALYDTAATPALLAQSADQLTAAWAADTVKTLALTTAQVVTATGIYYVAIMVKATTVPSLICRVAGRAAANGALLTGYKVKGLTSGAALTTTAPATLAAPTTVVNRPWVAVS